MSYPITELFAWIIDDPTGEHGIIAFTLEGDVTKAQAVTSNRRVADRVGIAAKLAAARMGRPVMLQRFVLAETVERVP